MFKKKFFWMLIILAIFSLSLLNIQMAAADEEPDEDDEKILVSFAPEPNIVMNETGTINFQ